MLHRDNSAEEPVTCKAHYLPAARARLCTCGPKATVPSAPACRLLLGAKTGKGVVLCGFLTKPFSWVVDFCTFNQAVWTIPRCCSLELWEMFRPGPAGLCCPGRGGLCGEGFPIPAARRLLLQERIPVAFTGSRGSWNVGLDGLCFRVGLVLG